MITIIHLLNASRGTPPGSSDVIFAEVVGIVEGIWLLSTLT